MITDMWDYRGLLDIMEENTYLIDEKKNFLGSNDPIIQMDIVIFLLYQRFD